MMQAPISQERPGDPPAVGAKLQLLRQAHKLSLDELSRRAGVSKSMLSQIERNQANPTVAVVWRLANALGVDLAEFLSEEPSRPTTPSIAVTAEHATPVMKSPDRKCELRILGPIELAGRLEWYRLSIEPGGVLASDAHERGAREHLTVLSGQVLVKSGTTEKKVAHGETARYPVDVQHSLSNVGKGSATALLVVEYTQ
jgi:transcriptional regulator with XRE-family HTH domain